MKKGILEWIGKSFWTKVLAFCVVFVALTGIFYWVVHKDWTETPAETDPVSRNLLLGEITQDQVLQQTFTADMDRLTSIYVDTAVLNDDGTSVLMMALLDGNTVLAHAEIPVGEMAHDGYSEFYIGSTENVRGKTLTLRMYATRGGISFWYGNTRSAGKFDVEAESTGVLTVGGTQVEGELVMRLTGVNVLDSAGWIWPGAALLLAVLLAVICRAHWCRLHGKKNVFLGFFDNLYRYRFLLKQLVSRDFKVRYKASVLGVLWSFLNPLLMTLVYNVVFSTIFNSNIDHFVVYLMSGIILFNYFSEATNLGMASIVGNASLITKVYIPKYIFPVSKTISSAINMVISLVPLLILMVATGVPLQKSMLLLPFVVVFMVALTTGIGLILSSMMVLFHDIQFLWSVFLTILNFLTPIFYPESIIPAAFIKLYHLNPLYQVLYFMRTITIGGVSPSPITYLYCTLASLLPLLLGIWVFRKSQDKFALYL